MSPSIKGVVSVPASNSSPQIFLLKDDDNSSLIVSILALCVSLGLGLYTYFKDSSERKFSIEDQYWLRQVVGPIAIEPLLKAILTMIASAPNDTSEQSFDAQRMSEFHERYLEKLAEWAANLIVLSLVNENLSSSTSKIIDEIQECLIDYCYHNKVASQTPTRMTKEAFQAKVREHLIEIMLGIKAYQIEHK